MTNAALRESHPASLSPEPAHLLALRDRIIGRIAQNDRVFGPRIPKIGQPDLTWSFCAPSDWVSGFWPGQLWLAYNETGEEAFADAARARRPFFQAILDDPHNQDHDLGFQFTLSSAFEFKLTGDKAAREMALRAAEALRGRFQQVGRYIKPWNHYPGADAVWAREAATLMIVDTLQNLSLLFWAHRQTGIESYRAIALAHAETSARYLVRPDGSTFHAYVFDPVTQEPQRGATHQGFADSSCWSRGQAWAIHGFAQIARTSGEPHYLELATQLADFAIAHLPADKVPEWDYLLPAGAPHHRDSSAGAITAAGLLLIADQLPAAKAQRYREAALEMLGGLMATCDLTENPAAQGLLDDGAYWVSTGQSHAMLTYGDYYYFEAVLRALGRRKFAWDDEQ